MRGVLVLIAIGVTAPAFAYDAPPVSSFAKPTADGRHVLVMLHPFERANGDVLNKKYARSGLYPIADPAKPVWTCEWRAGDAALVFASDDGVYAVRVPDSDPGVRRWLLSNDRRVPPKQAGWDDAPGLFVYESGRPVRTLTLRALFDCSRFTDRDCYMGPIVGIEQFRDADGRVTISAVADGKKLVTTISFRTGEVAEGDRGARASGESEPASERSRVRAVLIGALVVVVGTLAFAGLAAVLVRRGRARTG